MATINIYYMKPEFFSLGVMGAKPNVSSPQRLEKTHTFVKTLNESGEFFDMHLHLAFVKMQAEEWSPNGEARDLLVQKGLDHTSMCVGDVIEDAETGEMWVVETVGFVKLK